MNAAQDRERLVRVETELDHKADKVDIAALETRLFRNLLAVTIPIVLAFFAAAVGICLALL